MANKEELLAEAKNKQVDVPEGATKAEIQALLDKNAGEQETTPAEQADKDVEKSGVQGTDVDGSTVNEGADESEPDAKSDGANDEDQTVAAQADGVDGVDRDHTPAGTTDEANQTDAVERIQPPRAATGLNPEASDEAYDANTSVSPVESAAEVKARENEDNVDHVEARREESKEVETTLGSSEEEAAAARAGVQPERLNDPKQNREPKNVFEESNQKVTEEERQAAQEVSDMTTEQRVEDSPTPAEAAKTDAERTANVNQGAEIAAAIREASGKDKKFELNVDAGVEPRFSLVKNKDGEVMVRENETGHLSQLQLKSIEEKEASIQGQEVTEL